MPCFLQPIHERWLREDNDCHNPKGPGGGQFCSKGGTAGSHLVRPGEDYDLPATLTSTRLFLFNPGSGVIAIGDKDQKDRSHGEVLSTAQKQVGQSLDYDRFRVHGYFTVRNGKPEVQILRVVVSPDVADQDLFAARVDQLDAVEELGPRLAAWGLPADTPVTVAGWGGKGLRGQTLGAAFPESYTKKRRAA